MTDGREAVLKLTPTPAEAAAEAAALRAWERCGAAVRLLAADPGRGVLLLERVRPGTPLPDGDDDTATAVAADVLRRLQDCERPGFPFTALADAYAGYERRAREDADHELRTIGPVSRADVGRQRLPQARAAAMRLCATASGEVLLHGDLLDKNVLWNGTAYIAIDPMPHLGDPCADAGFFAAGHPPAAATLERAGALARRAGLDPDRAVRWAAVWAVGQACEGWRADSAELAALVSSRAVERLLEA